MENKQKKHKKLKQLSITIPKAEKQTTTNKP